jgi:uncharacterized membrane-anchored protein YitT (DUF2179 family)
MRTGNHSVTGIPYYPSTTPPQLNEPAPVQLAVAAPARQRRVTVAFRSLLAIPHMFVLFFLAIATEILAFLGWWGALFTGRLPGFAANYLTGYVRWNIRLSAYLMLLTDVYPPFTLEDDPSYPVRITLSQERLNRAAVFFRFILFIPAYIVAYFVSLGAGTIVSFIAWLVTLIVGKLPVSLHQAFTATLRYWARFICYIFLLTPTYPGGLFGDGPDSPVGAEAQPQAPQPGYGTPGYGTPGYGTPGYDTPGYGGPAYEASAYGAPSAGYAGGYAAPRPVFQPASWRLSLTSGAKRLLVLFIVLGMLTGVGYAILYTLVITSGVSDTVTTVNAINSMKASYSSLTQSMTKWENATAACHSSLSCVTAVDGTVAGDFSGFASRLQATAMPAKATAATDNLLSDASKAAQDFTQLSQSASVEQYQSTVASTDLQQTLDQFDQDFNTLMSTLSTP